MGWESVQKIGLGSVQFGLDYGISNPRGRVDDSEIGRILHCAENHGISVIDTAPAYGDAEEALGHWLEHRDFQVITKTRRTRCGVLGETELGAMRATFSTSLDKLRRQNVYALLVHDPNLLLGPSADKVIRWMSGLKRDGATIKIGVSVYHGTEAEEITRRFDLDIIQVPINIVDQRLIQSGQLRRLHAKGLEIHARSAFLQGALLASVDSLPTHFASVKGTLTKLRSTLKERDVGLLQACLGFVTALPEVSRVIVGVTSVNELSEILNAVAKPFPKDLDLESFALDDEKILNPSCWSEAFPERTSSPWRRAIP